MSAPTFGYSINLDERGEFYADVRDAAGTSLFEIHAPDDQGGSIFEDGYMKHKDDLSGLESYLVDLGIIPDGSEILPLARFERRLEEEARRQAEPEDELEPAM